MLNPVDPALPPKSERPVSLRKPLRQLSLGQDSMPASPLISTRNLVPGLSDSVVKLDRLGKGELVVGAGRRMSHAGPACLCLKDFRCSRVLSVSCETDLFYMTSISFSARSHFLGAAAISTCPVKSILRDVLRCTELSLCSRYRPDPACFSQTSRGYSPTAPGSQDHRTTAYITGGRGSLFVPTSRQKERQEIVEDDGLPPNSFFRPNDLRAVPCEMNMEYRTRTKSYTIMVPYSYIRSINQRTFFFHNSSSGITEIGGRRRPEKKGGDRPCG